MRLNITEPRDVPVTELPDYVGWRLSPVYAIAGATGPDSRGMVSGVILNAEADGTQVTVTYEHETTDGRGRRTAVTDSAVLAAAAPSDSHPFTRPAYVEVVTSHTVPDSVPGNTPAEQHRALFDRVDGRGITIAEAIASFEADNARRGEGR